ncbi:MAG TPA: helix-turn-helix domain-containing protein [Candidatus Limnocylindria bacterium]|nr:helix-turn-helix domain-containing protein [Candidatus Limnocylindria bacterium]
MPDDHKRQRILAAATAVFAERDFHRVQVSHVATRARVGKGTVYLYFPSKDDLHQAALEASLKHLADEVEQAAAAEASVETVLREIVLRIIRFFWKRQHLLTFVQRYERRGGRPRGRRHRALKAVDGVLARHGFGGHRTRHLDAAFLLGLARAAILEHAASDRPEAVAQHVVDVYLRGVPRTAS